MMPAGRGKRTREKEGKRLRVAAKERTAVVNHGGFWAHQSLPEGRNSLIAGTAQTKGGRGGTSGPA